MPYELDDALLTRYLLGTCSDDEETRVEDRYFADDATFERLCCLEDALIEERLDGRLDGEARSSFDRRHDGGRRRDRLLVTAALRRAAADGRLARKRSFIRPAWIGVAAALAVVVLGAGLLVAQN